jgi:chromosome segregation ATPase
MHSPSHRGQVQSASQVLTKILSDIMKTYRLYKACVSDKKMVESLNERFIQNMVQFQVEGSERPRVTLNMSFSVIQEQSGMFKDFQKEYSFIREEIDNIGKEQNHLKERMDDMEKKMEHMNNRITDMLGELATLETRILGLRSQLRS